MLKKMMKAVVIKEPTQADDVKLTEIISKNRLFRKLSV